MSTLIKLLSTALLGVGVTCFVTRVSSQRIRDAMAIAAALGFAGSAVTFGLLGTITLGLLCLALGFTVNKLLGGRPPQTPAPFRNEDSW